MTPALQQAEAPLSAEDKLTATWIAQAALKGYELVRFLKKIGAPG